MLRFEPKLQVFSFHSGKKLNNKDLRHFAIFTSQVREKLFL